MTRFTRLIVALGLLTFALGGCGEGHSAADGHDHDADGAHVDEGSPGHDEGHGSEDGDDHEPHDGEDQ